MAERFKAHAWKVCVGLKAYREFESLPIRHFFLLSLSIVYVVTFVCSLVCSSELGAFVCSVIPGMQSSLLLEINKIVIPILKNIAAVPGILSLCLKLPLCLRHCVVFKNIIIREL